MRKIIPKRLAGERYSLFEGTETKKILLSNRNKQNITAISSNINKTIHNNSSSSSNVRNGGSTFSNTDAHLLPNLSNTSTTTTPIPSEEEIAQGIASILANIDAASQAPRITARQGTGSWSALRK